MKYDFMGETEDGYFKLKFTEGPFSDIIFSLGRVELLEEDDQARLGFDYNILSGVPEDKNAFETACGDLLVQMITEGLEKQSLIYSGGVDEN
jgi:hypothetical protein